MFHKCRKLSTALLLQWITETQGWSLTGPGSISSGYRPDPHGGKDPLTKNGLRETDSMYIFSVDVPVITP